MEKTILKRGLRLSGVVVSQTLFSYDVGLLTDKQNEFPILLEGKGLKLARLVGERVEVEADLATSDEGAPLALSIRRFRLSDPSDLEPYIMSVDTDGKIMAGKLKEKQQRERRILSWAT